MTYFERGVQDRPRMAPMVLRTVTPGMGSNGESLGRESPTGYRTPRGNSGRLPFMGASVIGGNHGAGTVHANGVPGSAYFRSCRPCICGRVHHLRLCASLRAFRRVQLAPDPCKPSTSCSIVVE